MRVLSNETGPSLLGGPVLPSCLPIGDSRWGSQCVHGRHFSYISDITMQLGDRTMRYWDDFQSKYGFGDGSDVPPDAPAVRQVYVEEINKRATALKSTYRVVAWDRPGCHNPFFILKVPLEVYNCFDQRWVATGLYDPGTLRDWDVSKTDEALEQAIADVGEAGVEYWVDCKVTIRRPRKCKIH